MPKAVKCDMYWDAGYGYFSFMAGCEFWRRLEELYRDLSLMAGGVYSVNVYKVTCTLT